MRPRTLFLALVVGALLSALTLTVSGQGVTPGTTNMPGQTPFNITPNLWITGDLQVDGDEDIDGDLYVGGSLDIDESITSANYSVIGSLVCIPLVSHQAAVAQNDDWGIELPMDGVIEAVSLSTFSGTVASAEIKNVTNSDTLLTVASVNATPESYAMTAVAASCEFDTGDVIELNIAGSVSSPDGFTALLWVRSTSALSTE